MAVSTIPCGLESITVASGIVATRRGSIVTVAFNGVTITNYTARTTFGTLPSGWRPSADVFGANIDGYTGYGDVQTDGSVQAFRPNSGHVTSTVSYVATN